MTDDEILNIYTALVPFLADICGSECEVLIHDVRNPEQSIITIANNITKRNIGDPMTDLARSIQKQGQYKTEDFMTNYTGHTKDKTFLSSTFFIKNEDRLIGLLCINRDCSATAEFIHTFQTFLKKHNLVLPASETSTRENLDTPMASILRNLVEDTIADTGVLPERMSMQEKVHIVHILNDKGALTMKGAVAEIAAQLKISEPTVYRYLNRKE